MEKYDTRNRCYRVKSRLNDKGWFRTKRLYLINVLALSLVILQLDMLNTCCSGIFKNLIGFATFEVLLCLSIFKQHSCSDVNYKLCKMFLPLSPPLCIPLPPGGSHVLPREESTVVGVAFALCLYVQCALHW